MNTGILIDSSNLNVCESCLLSNGYRLMFKNGHSCLYSLNNVFADIIKEQLLPVE